MTSLKMFVASSPLHQYLTLIIGLIILILSILIFAYFKKNFDFYFDNSFENNDLLKNIVDTSNASEDYPDWVRSSNEVEYAAITQAERLNSPQVFT